MLDRAWLALTPEDPIDLGFPIVDPHHHLWPGETKYGPYGLDDLREDTEPNGIAETVFVECGAAYRTHGPDHLRSVGETEWAAEQAALSRETQGARIAAIVAHVDLTRGELVGDTLDAHAEASGGLLRGIRHSAARTDEPSVSASRTDPPYGLHGQRSFRAGARALADRGLSFEAWQYHLQLVDLLHFVEHFEDLAVVINHLGGPLGVGRFAPKRDEVWGLLRAQLRKLASHENVTVKLGGIGMLRYGNMSEATGRPPSSDLVIAHWGRMLEFVIDLFGPDRAMFESNYPVDGESISSTVLWNAYKKVAAKYSPAEQEQLFAGTARRVYRL